MLPLLDPDVVRLDVNVVKEHELRRISEVFEAVRAHSLMTGSLVMAEGVTSAADENTVGMLGSSLAAGPFYYARGEHAAEAAIVSEMLGQRTQRLLAAHSSPYTLVTARQSPRSPTNAPSWR